MARQKSEFTKAFGTAFEVFKSLSDEVLSLGGNDDNIRRILTDQNIRRLCAELLINGTQGTKEASTTYPVSINYDDTFEQHLAAGRYDWENSDINEKNFPVENPACTDSGCMSPNPAHGEIVKRDLELAHYNKDMSTEAVLAAIEAQGYRPATIEELLAFGAAYPELQREFPIVALGSVWRDWAGRRYVACLYRRSDGRGLDLHWVEGGWSELYRFLVVRK